MRYIISNSDEVFSEVERLITKFASRVCHNNDGVERRVALKFGLVYAGGKIAVREGYLPWNDEHSYRVTRKLFRNSMKVRRTAKQQSQASVEAYAKQILKDETYKALNGVSQREIQEAETTRGGFYIRMQQRKVLCLREEELRRHLASDFDAIVYQFQQRSILLPGHGGKRTKQLRTSGSGKRTRYYCLDAELLALLAQTGS